MVHYDFYPAIKDYNSNFPLARLQIFTSRTYMHCPISYQDCDRSSRYGDEHCNLRWLEANPEPSSVAGWKM